MSSSTELDFSCFPDEILQNINDMNNKDIIIDEYALKNHNERVQKSYFYWEESESEKDIINMDNNNNNNDIINDKKYILTDININKKNIEFKSKKSIKQINNLVTKIKYEFSCEFCEKSFKQKGNLKRHLITHSKKKDFICDYIDEFTNKKCNKSFGLKYNLKRHKKIHFKLKPFQCEICNNKFTHNSKLKKHKKIHDNNNQHKCYHKNCSKQFKNLNSFNIHLKNIHCKFQLKKKT